MSISEEYIGFLFLSNYYQGQFFYRGNKNFKTTLKIAELSIVIFAQGLFLKLIY